MATLETLDYIENRTYDEIKVGDSASLTRTMRPEDIQMFAIMSGDINPTHVDPEYARSSMFREVVAHGMWGGMLISNVLGTEFPGPGTVAGGQVRSEGRRQSRNTEAVGPCQGRSPTA